MFKEICLVASGDSRLSANRVCWPAQAALEATEEAVLNSLFAATTTRGFEGHVAEALPLDRVLEILRRRGALTSTSEGRA